MRYGVLILSEDTVFARMLELEFSMYHFVTHVAPLWVEGMEADVVLIDLDSLPPPPMGSYGCLIGFTRAFSVNETDPERLCSMILHRPFEIRLLREEVLAVMPTDVRGRIEIPKRVRRTWRLSGQTLSYGEREVALSPTEAAVAQLLLQNEGRAVSREAIAAAIGEGESNKTDVYICYLRRKAEALSEIPFIRTVRGKGYRFG